MSNRQETSNATRAGIAIGFAAFAIAAVMSSASAGIRTAAQSATGEVGALPASADDLGAQVDWSRVQTANITPAESVAAYDR